jgi:hypothetical protein
MRFAAISRLVLVVLALAAPAAAQPGSDPGTLVVTIRPASADVFIDGERWVSSDPSAPLEVQLAPGRHSIDVRARGYQRFRTVVDVRPGESTPLNVSLPAGVAPPQLRGPSAPPPPRPGQIQRVEPSGDGFVLAPDFKITEMNNRTTGFAGFYGGAVFAGQVMLGGGAYFQLDDYASEQMAYGGFVAEYRLFHNHPVGVALHGLAGFGATNVPIYGHGGRYGYGYSPYYGGCGYGYAYYGCPYDGFFIGEPEVRVAGRVSDSLRLVGGIGYRFTSSDFYRLNGVVGSISVQFGR